MRRIRLFVALLFAILGVPAGAQTAPQVDLVLLLDGSGSISSADWQTQLQGYASALSNPSGQVLPRDGSFRVGVVQFSTSARTEISPRVIASPADANQLANDILSINQIGGSTGVARGIRQAWSVLQSLSSPAPERRICMSTDGTDNVGGSPSSEVNSARSGGLTAFGVVAIEDGSFNRARAQSEYGPLLFGCGPLVVAQNAADFANKVGGTCFRCQPFKVVGIEVVQISQDLNNSVRLAANNSTWVRVHVEPGDMMATSQSVQADLARLNSSGDIIDTITGTSGSSTTAVQKALLQRGALNSSDLVFSLPSSWTTAGTLRLQVLGVSGTPECLEDMGTSGDCAVQVTFESVDTPEIRFFDIVWMEQGGQPQPIASNAEYSNLLQRFLAVTPAASVLANRQTFATSFTVPVGQTPDPINVLFPLEQQRTIDKLNCAQTSQSCSEFYMGLIRVNTATQGFGVARQSTATGVSGFQVGGSLADYNTVAHEYGHLVGMPHTCSCTGDSSCVATNHFTAPLGSMGRTVTTLGPMPAGNTLQSATSQELYGLVYGYDYVRQLVVDPFRTFELMDYCRDVTQWRWASKESTADLLDGTNTVFPRPAGQLGGPTEVVMVSGSVNVQTLATSIQPLVRLTSAAPPPPPPPGPYELVLIDQGGTELSRTPFDIPPPLAPGGPADERNFIVVVPFAQGTSSIAIETNGQVIGTRVGSPNVPTVTVTFPDGGEQLDGLTTIAWTAGDADGDDPAFTIQRSADGGTTWDTIAVNYDGLSIETDFSNFPSTAQGLVRVIASDGFNTAEDVSDAFFSTDKPPTIDILTPADQSEFSGVEPITFRAIASDIEDGPLAGGDITWISDVDGVIGTGEVFDYRADLLSEAEHVITAIAEDSSGQTAEATIEIAVEVIFTPDRPGDFDFDDDVDLADLQMLLASIGASANDAAYFPDADFNADGYIGLTDFEDWYTASDLFVSAITLGDRIAAASSDAPRGACCTGSAVVMLPEADCADAGGIWSGAGVEPADADCATGSCIADVAAPYGTLDVDDLLAFLIAFRDGHPSADTNMDLDLNIDDVTVFLNSFASGCAAD